VGHPPGARSRIAAVDGFRAYAILGVVTIHLLGAAGALQPGTTTSLVVWGLLGNVIDAFFIVSGFVLFLGVVERGGRLGSLRAFAAVRGARLIPAYWITLALMLALLALVPAAISTAEGVPSLPNVLVHLGGMQMPARMIDSNILPGFGINGALWMISVIVGFYLVFPLIAKPFYRHPLAGLAIAAAITLGWKEAALHLSGPLTAFNLGDQPEWSVALIASNQLPGWAFSFALGMTAAWGYTRIRATGRSAQARDAAVWIGAVAVIACLACAYVYGRDASEVSGAIGGSVARSSPLLGLAYSFSRAALMAAIVLGPTWAQAPFANRPTRGVAELSYSTYLIHLVVAAYVGISLLALPTDGSLRGIALWFGTVVPISLLYAYVMRRWIELPASAWSRRVSRPGARRSPESASAPAATASAP